MAYLKFDKVRELMHQIILDQRNKEAHIVRGLAQSFREEMPANAALQSMEIGQRADGVPLLKASVVATTTDADAAMSLADRMNDSDIDQKLKAIIADL